MSDPYASNVVLHLPFNQELLLSGKPFDMSPRRNRVEVVGNAGLSELQAKFGNRSCRFDGTGDSLTIPYSSAFDFGTQDFCIETWVYPAVAGLTKTQTLLSRWVSPGDRQFLFYFNGADFGFIINNVGFALAVHTPYVAGVWTHVAIVRAGSVFTLYMNGVASATAGSAVAFANSASGLMIGHQQEAVTGNIDWCLNGYLDDLRVTVGVSRYTANFTPPDAIEYNFSPTLARIDPETTLSAFPIPSHTARQLDAITGSNDMYYGGNGKVIGTTKNTPSAPVSRRVRLHESRSGHLIREGWSDAAGNYSFTHLSRDYTYYVVGFDHTDQYQGVVADKLVPEAM